MIPGAVHRSPGIFLTAEGKSRKTSVRRPSDEGLYDQSSPQMGYLTPNDGGRIAQHIRM
jgi:hypothetical protein